MKIKSRSLWILDLIGFDLHFHFQSWNRFFYQIYLRSFCIIYSETSRLSILVRPSLATDRISLGFWLNISFVVNYRGAFRSIVAIAIDLLTSEDRYFLFITAVPLPRRCLQSRQHIRYWACTVLHSRWVGHPICDPSRIIATWFSYGSVNPLRPQNCIYLQSDLSCLNKLNCNIFKHHERLYFPLHRPAPAIRHLFLVGCDSWWWQAAEPASWLRNNLSIPRAPENMSHKNIITIYFHIST